jgi:hypothetical protein
MEIIARCVKRFEMEWEADSEIELHGTVGLKKVFIKGDISQEAKASHITKRVSFFFFEIKYTNVLASVGIASLC